MSVSSYKRSTSAQITEKPGVLTAYFVGTDGNNNASISVYDVNSASEISDDNMIQQCTVLGSARYGGRNIVPSGLKFARGLYVAVSGVGAYYFVEWQ